MSRLSFFSCTHVILLVIFCTAKQIETYNMNDTRNRLLPAYAIASRADRLNLTICRKELQAFQNAIDHKTLWGLRVLDSSGKPVSGFLYGNNFWLGSRNQCYDTMNTNPLLIAERAILNNTLYRDPREEFPPFEVNYFIAYFKHNSTLQYQISIPNKLNDLMTLGLCLPASCSTNDLHIILEGIFRDRVLLISDTYSMDFKLVEIKDPKIDHQWLFSGGVLFIGFVLAFIFILMTVGTIYDVFVYQKHLKAIDLTSRSKNKAFSQDTPNCDESDLKKVPENVNLMSSSLNKNSKITQVLRCFSVYTNTRILFNTKQNANAIPAIHGLKFLAMLNITLGHVLYFQIDYVDNFTWSWRLMNQLIGSLIGISYFSVDTFFFLSGFLLTYNYLKKVTHKMQPKLSSFIVQLNNLSLIILKRFFRLTPAYMMAIGIAYLSLSWLSRTSQFHISQKLHETCAKYWWRNLFYINNLYDSSTMCLIWTWYLACDMQFFIITSILLMLSSIYFYVAPVALCILLIGSIFLNGYIPYVNEFILTWDVVYINLDVTYFPPWMRIGPYIIGMFTGYIVIKTKKNLAVNRRTLVLCWCISIACICIVFSVFIRHMSVLIGVFSQAFSKTIWAIGLAWILLACYTNHGGIVQKLLSFKCWIPLSRLTYCVYLINPILIHGIYMYGESTIHVDVVHEFFKCSGFIMISYICAYVLSLMSEMPFARLMEIFSQRDGKRKTRHLQL